MIKIKCPKCGTEIELDKSSYNELLNDIASEEVDKRVSEQTKALKEKYDAQLALEQNKAKQDNLTKLLELQNEIKILEEKLKNSDSKTELEVNKANSASKEKLNQKDQEILKLKNDFASLQKDAEIAQAELKKSYDFIVKQKDEEIERYKNFRLGDSTKDLGESLEQYCHDAFDEIRAVAYPRAYFEKDNDVDEQGKGDFIFKDYAEDGTEIVSIMFEMKNQKDTTKTKQKNEHFFDKLDKNRTTKGCEYAVLVTTLEEDSKLYNTGIVDVSYRYPKMFVVRPQNFLSIIGLIRNMAINNLVYKQQVIAYQKENADITNFENAVRAVADKINNDYENASKQYSQVEKMCDDMIKKLQDFKETFRLGQKWLGAAQNQLPNLEIRKLTHNNPTMKEKFDQIKKD